MPRVVRPAGGQLAPAQKPHGGKFNVRRAVLLDLVNACHDGKHAAGNVLALFKLAFRDRDIGQRKAVLSQNRLHRHAQRLIQQIVAPAPRGKVLSAVHDARKRARYRQRRHGNVLAAKQPEDCREGFRERLRASLRQRNIQPREAASGLFSGGVLPAPLLRKAAQLLIPALRALIVRRHRAEHAHALHQRRRGENFRFRQAPVIGCNLAVVPHAGVQLRVPDEKLGDFGVVAVLCVAVQRAGVVLFELVIEPAPAEKRLSLLFGVFALELPEKKRAELRPEVILPGIVIVQHRRVAKQPFPTLPRARQTTTGYRPDQKTAPQRSERA